MKLRHPVIVLFTALACAAGIMWHAASNRTPTVLASGLARPESAAESLTFQALIDSAAGMGVRYAREIRTIPEHDDKRRLHSTLDYLRRVTYLYYDWAISGAASVSAETINTEYLRPAVESILKARPELANGREGFPSKEAVVRLYFFEHGLFLVNGVINAPDGLGRFPSLELLPIVKETPLDAVVWGRRMDAVVFAVRGSFIFDIVSYSRGESTGANMKTMNTIVCHHLDREADFVNAVRHDMQRACRETPPPLLDADAMGQGLVYLALQPYLSLKEESAVSSFVEDWSETSYIHELGHMFSKQAKLGLVPQTGEEEAVAFLTELRFGAMPHYTLYNMYKVGIVEEIHPHKEGMKIVYADFARRIRAAKQRGDGFDAINVGADTVEVDVLEGIVYQFPKLRSDEIRALADGVFEEKYRARVKD